VPTRRVLRGVLWNFLGTFTSRYSDHRGYWLFGFLVVDFETLDFDLLADPLGQRLSDATHRLAVDRFMEQLAKAGLDRSNVADARLRIVRGHQTTRRQHEGWDVHFVALAVADSGRQFECRKTVFVAPHDPTFERRSARADAL
jgi:hypothetical protein